MPPPGSHLPHIPRSPYKHSSPSPALHPGPDTVLTRGPVPSSSLLPPPPPPPPCPTGPGEAAAWGCCCSLGGAATPFSRYLGKVGHAALPLLNIGGLLNAEPSDVQTWDVWTHRDRELLTSDQPEDLSIWKGEDNSPETLGDFKGLRRATHDPEIMGCITEPTGYYKMLYADKEDLMLFYLRTSFAFQLHVVKLMCVWLKFSLISTESARLRFLTCFQRNSRPDELDWLLLPLSGRTPLAGCITSEETTCDTAFYNWLQFSLLH